MKEGTCAYSLRDCSKI